MSLVQFPLHVVMSFQIRLLETSRGMGCLSVPLFVNLFGHFLNEFWAYFGGYIGA